MYIWERVTSTFIFVISIAFYIFTHLNTLLKFAARLVFFSVFLHVHVMRDDYIRSDDDYEENKIRTILVYNETSHTKLRKFYIYTCGTQR